MAHYRVFSREQLSTEIGTEKSIRHQGTQGKRTKNRIFSIFRGNRRRGILPRGFKRLEAASTFYSPLFIEKIRKIDKFHLVHGGLRFGDGLLIPPTIDSR